MSRELREFSSLMRVGIPRLHIPAPLFKVSEHVQYGRLARPASAVRPSFRPLFVPPPFSAFMMLNKNCLFTTHAEAEAAATGARAGGRGRISRE